MKCTYHWLKEFVEETGNLVGQLQGRITNPFKPYHPGKRGQAIPQNQRYQSE